MLVELTEFFGLYGIDLFEIVSLVPWILLDILQNYLWNS